MKVSCDVLWKLQIKILQEIIFTSLHLEAIVMFYATTPLLLLKEEMYNL